MYADKEEDTYNNPYNISEDILDGLFTRFLSDTEERKDYNRLMFCVEQAHWHYIDYICSNRKNNFKLSFRKFTLQLLATYGHILFQDFPTPILPPDNIIEEFLEYKRKVPTYGCILIDKTHNYCLMVRGANARISWGFPKGKRNQEELPEQCAVRETLEEIGFDCSDMVTTSTDHLDSRCGESTTRLYLVNNIDMKTAHFYPATRNEIRDIKWFLIDELPDENKDDDNSRVCEDLNLTHSNFFIAIPFVTPLRRWCSKKKLEYETRRRMNEKGKRKIRPLMMDKFHVQIPVANHDEVEKRLAENNKQVKKTIMPLAKDEKRTYYGNLSKNFERMFGDQYIVDRRMLPLAPAWSKKEISNLKLFSSD